MGMRRLALLALIMAMFSGEAQGHHTKTHSAVQVARTTWGQACDGKVTVRWRDLPGNAAGMAQWSHYLDDPRRRANCVITIDKRRWGWKWLCTIMVHEWGHLKGREHSRNRRSVMYPRLVRVYKRCR